MVIPAPWFSESFGVLRWAIKLSPGYTQGFVDNLWMEFAVGTLQRARSQ